MIRASLIDARSGCRASSEEPRDAVKRTTEVIVRELAAVIKHGHNLRRDSAEPTGKPKTENSRLSSCVRSPAWAPRRVCQTARCADSLSGSHEYRLPWLVLHVRDRKSVV